MRQITGPLSAITLLIAGILVASNALASKPVAPQVTGHVTRLASADVIYVDGRRYWVAAGSAAWKMIGTIRVGDSVELILNGPVGSSASQVTIIQKSD